MLRSDGFNGKGWKGNYRWLQGAEITMNPVLLSPVLEQLCLVELVNRNN